MASQDFSKLTLQELQSKYNKLKGAAIGLGIVLIAACVTLLYLAFTTEQYYLSGVAIGCFITMIPSIIVLFQLKTELDKRKLSLKTLKDNRQISKKNS